MQPCSICPRNYQPIRGDGPQPCRLLFIGERPGENENKLDCVFVGRSGEELDHTYLPLAGLRRPDVRITNAVKCLRSSTRVILADGSTERVNKLVKDRYKGKVKCVDHLGRLSTTKVTGWYRSPLASRRLLRVRYEHYISKGSRGKGGSVVTEDHQFLTKSGEWVAAADLKQGQLIATGTPGLSDRQISMAIGMILGDGWIGESRALTVAHCEAQHEYALYKRICLENLGMINFSKFGFSSRRLPVINWFSQKVGKVTIDRDFVKNYFNYATLAIWYMDDGCMHWNRTGSNGSAEICATGRDTEDLEWLSKFIWTELGLPNKVSKGRIFFSTETTKEFCNLLARWFPPSMRYKLLPGSPQFDPHLYDYDRPVFFDGAVIEPFTGKQEKSVYCLRTKSENFATLGGIVHNCWADNNKTPTDKEIQICGSHWLPREIERCKPEAIVLLGGCASKLTNGLINLETHHGRPIKVNNFVGSGWSGYVWPTYHPAMGLHATEKMTPLLDDFELLGKWLNGNWSPPTPYTGPRSYRLIKDASEFYRYLQSANMGGEYKFPSPAVDTERHGPKPFSIQFSLYPHSGRMILADSHALHAFRKWSADQEFTLHNAPQDLDLLQYGFGVVPRSIRDTMQEAFHLGNQPQKLKALAYRLLGVTMRTWEDVVRPASVNAALEWLGEALQIAQEDLRLVEFVRMKTKTKEVYKNSPTASAITRIIRCSNNPEYDIWEKIDEHWTKGEGLFDSDRSHIENRLGPMPILGIGNCLLADAVDYGCSDADHTGQVADELEKLRGSKEYEIDEDDRDNQD